MDWEDFWSAVLSVLGAVLCLAIVCITCLWIFAGHDAGVYFRIDYATHAFPEYEVKMDRRWAEDRLLFSSQDQAEAQAFYEWITSQ